MPLIPQGDSIDPHYRRFVENVRRAGQEPISFKAYSELDGKISGTQYVPYGYSKS